MRAAVHSMPRYNCDVWTTYGLNFRLWINLTVGALRDGLHTEQDHLIPLGITDDVLGLDVGDEARFLVSPGELGNS